MSKNSKEMVVVMSEQMGTLSGKMETIRKNQMDTPELKTAIIWNEKFTDWVSQQIEDGRITSEPEDGSIEIDLSGEQREKTLKEKTPKWPMGQHQVV